MFFSVNRNYRQSTYIRYIQKVQNAFVCDPCISVGVVFVDFEVI
jgi:hypothetical protein